MRCTNAQLGRLRQCGRRRKRGFKEQGGHKVQSGRLRLSSRRCNASVESLEQPGNSQCLDEQPSQPAVHDRPQHDPAQPRNAPTDHLSESSPLASLRSIRPNRAKNAIVCINKFFSSPDAPTTQRRVPICDALCVYLTRFAICQRFRACRALPHGKKMPEFVTDFLSTGHVLQNRPRADGVTVLCHL